MKKLIICTGLILMFGIFGFGQKDRGVVLDSGTRIDGQLQSTVDVKKSKVGDEVVLKTTKAIKQDGQTVVPKGSRLIGRITEVQEKTKSNGGSKLGMVFERIEGKNLATPINASIVSLTSVMANNRVADSADSDLFATSSSSTRTSGNRSSGGGLLGGVTNSVGGVANTGGGLLNTTTQTVGGVTNTVGQTVSNAGGSVFSTVDGIAVSNTVSGSVRSGSTLSAANKNIKLEKGLVVGVMLNGSISSQ